MEYPISDGPGAVYVAKQQGKLSAQILQQNKFHMRLKSRREH